MSSGCGYGYNVRDARKVGKIEDSVVLSERKIYDHPKTGLLWERHLEHIPLEKKDGSIWLGMPVLSSRKWTLLIGVRGSKQIGWKETKTVSNVNKIQKQFDLDDPIPLPHQLHVGCKLGQPDFEGEARFVDKHRFIKH